MATSYALPASAITHSHSHHGHSHIHSHSHSSSPARSSANSTRSMKHERSTGSLHSFTHHPESRLEQDHNNHNHTHVPQQPGHLHTPSCNHRTREPSPLGQYPTPPNSDGVQPAPFQKNTYEHSPALSHSASYEPPHDAAEAGHHHHDHDHDRDHHDSHEHTHSHASPAQPRSKFTSFVLPYTQRFPLLYTIMADKDSRRIFYFMSLNFTFMLVQAFYGFVTDSLGLLSDSIHMLFDCLALGVGLFASIASKWPPSERFPYGFGKIESLSGFGNGVFLMLISIEIMIEATERLAEGRPTKRLLELFIVSSMGLAVNLVGMACFGHHGHHGHDHGHDHGHSHSHSHEKSHSHDEKSSCDHSHGEHGHGHSHDSHDHVHAPLLSEKVAKPHSHGHSHSHDNENMHGIFLHILADTMGSAAVMVSTTLIYFVGWNGWDPLASCIIAILIFMSSIPLIKSSAKKLLLTVPGDTEYALRESLASVSGLRGVASYTVPRFWMGDNGAVEGGDHVLGVMHIQATRGSDLEDVKERARALLQERGMDVVIQVEAVTETGCWCGGVKELNLRRYS